MPIYEYACTACDHRTDILHGINDPGPQFCPSCGRSGTMRKLFAPPTIHYRGSGWAKKDRGGSGAGTRASAGSKGSDGSSSESKGSGSGSSAGSSSGEGSGKASTDASSGSSGSSSGGSSSGPSGD